MCKEIIGVVMRTILVLIVLFAIAKIIGKKQISQLNLFDYIMGITIGSIAADISLDINKNLIAGLTSLFIYVIVSLLISFITMKSIILRRFLNGVPTILVEKGNIIESGLRKTKIDVNALLEEARNSGYFDLDEIEYALMEANGKISFLPKEKHKPVTKKDIVKVVDNSFLVANVIIDEKILEENLRQMKKNKKWLMKQLKIYGFNDSKGIILATLDNNEKLKIYKKNIDVKQNSILE